MNSFTKQISIRWADIDPNFHVRHSVYYDFGAQHRVELLQTAGLTLQLMQEQNFGPVVFREECVFKREIRFADHVSISTKISKMKPDASRWSIEHILLNQEAKICAKITVEGAWIDTKSRKLRNDLPKIAVDVMNSFPKSENFSEI